MAIRIEMLRCFLAVAESGHLAGAAERLNRSVSAVSMTLGQLETHLGSSLFETDRKRVLSPLGRFVAEEARAGLRQFDRTVEAIERYARDGVGVVRVAAVPSMAALLLPAAFDAFLAERGDVQVRLRETDSAGVLRALAHERADIGIATVADTAWTGRRSPLFRDEFGLVCRRDHALAASDGALAWRELEGEPFIGNELCEGLGSPEARELCRRARLVVDNTGSLLAMVRAGTGVTVLPRAVTGLHPGDVAFRPLDDPSAVRRIDLLRHPEGTAPPLVEELARHVLEAAGALGANPAMP